MKATIFDIEHCSFVDGPGIRTTVFFKGCNLKCSWCHNPESQAFKPQMMFYRDKCTNCGKCIELCSYKEGCVLCGKCEIYCPAEARKISGKEYIIDEILDEILRDKKFYDNSDGGVTFSGGECMLQIDFLVEILRKCKENDIHTAVDTAGNVPYEYFEKIFPYVDLFLYDIKIFDSEKHREYTGVSNELILKNFETLLNKKTKIWVRIPIISKVNDSIEELEKIKRFIYKNGHPEKIELLPYHAMGENKYNALGITPCKYTAPTNDKMIILKKVFNQ